MDSSPETNDVTRDVAFFARTTGFLENCAVAIYVHTILSVQ